MLGQTGKLVSSKLVQARERDLLLKPIEAQEFLFASSLLINNNKVTDRVPLIALSVHSRPVTGKIIPHSSCMCLRILPTDLQDIQLPTPTP